MAAYYAHLDSDELSTNLQLYSLKQAAFHWNEFVRLKRENGLDDVPESKERLAFILVCFGLSLAQLLGQQSKSKEKRTPAPHTLLDMVLRSSSLEQDEQRRLQGIFSDFIYYYDASRHFGKSKHHIVDRLTFTKLNQFRNMTLEIWDLVIALHRKDKRNDIDEFFIAEELDFLS